MEKDGKFAFVATVGTKGQIVIPAKVRKMFNFNPGETVLILADKNRGVALVKSEEYSRILDEVIQNNMPKM